VETKNILLIIQIILSIFLILSILLQVRGSGLGTIFGGVGGEFYRSKRGIEKFLSRATIVIAILFVSNCVAITYLYAK
jgi:preprotein translocase subunit SecG